MAPDGVTAPMPVSVATAFAAWLAMAGAMMLPTVVPLVRFFVPITTRVPRPVTTRLAFLGGYLAVWVGFAAVAVLGDGGVDALARVRAWPVAPSELVLAVTLVVAGLFQFSRLKDTCLTACRSPWAFLWQHYRRGVRGGWMLGVRHGALCLGCCWALMLIMFGAGAGSLLWMLALTVVIVIEKTAPRGTRLVAPLGGALVLAGAAVPAWPSRPSQPEVLSAPTARSTRGWALCWWRPSAWRFSGPSGRQADGGAQVAVVPGATQIGSDVPCAST